MNKVRYNTDEGRCYDAMDRGELAILVRGDGELTPKPGGVVMITDEGFVELENGNHWQTEVWKNLFTLSRFQRINKATIEREE